MTTTTNRLTLKKRCQTGKMFKVQLPSSSCNRFSSNNKFASDPGSFHHRRHSDYRQPDNIGYEHRRETQISRPSGGPVIHSGSEISLYTAAIENIELRFVCVQSSSRPAAASNNNPILASKYQDKSWRRQLRQHTHNVNNNNNHRTINGANDDELTWKLNSIAQMISFVYYIHYI